MTESKQSMEDDSIHDLSGIRTWHAEGECGRDHLRKWNNPRRRAAVSMGETSRVYFIPIQADGRTDGRTDGQEEEETERESERHPPHPSERALQRPPSVRHSG